MPVERTRRYTRRKKRITGLTNRQKRAVMQIIDKKDEQVIENKFYDTVFDGVNIDSSFSNAGVYQINNVSEGTSSNQRIGQDIDVKSIFARLVFTLGDTTNLIRLMIVQDRNSKNNGNNYPAISEVLEYTTGFATQQYLMSPLKVSSEKGRWRVLLDNVVILNANEPQFVLEWYKEVNIKKTFEKAAGANSEGKNSIYIMWVSDSGADPDPDVSGVIRCKYIDA